MPQMLEEIPLFGDRPAGLDNRARETEVTGLRVCQNLDQSSRGNFITRKGLRQVISGDAHSLHPFNGAIYGVLDGDLVRFDGTTATVLKTLSSTSPVSFAPLNDALYWVTPSEQGRIQAGANTLWGLPTPPTPVCAAVSGAGGLNAGRYQVTWTALSNGLESGAPEPALVEVTQGGGIQVNVISGATFRIFVTEANGTQFRKAGDFTTGTVTLGTGARGKPLESLHAVKPLPGQYITSHKGRLYVASDTVVWFTDSRSPHWLMPHEGYFLFDSPVTLLVAVEDGLYIAAGNTTYFLQGTDPYKAALRPVQSYGAIPYTGQNQIPHDVLLGQGAMPLRRACWYDTQGVFCVGHPGGFIQRVTSGQFWAGNAARGAVAYREHEGIRQFVAVLHEAAPVGVATDVPIAQVFANGVVLNG